MLSAIQQSGWIRLWATTLLVVHLAGCAQNRLPRIDPSGRRLLIFPDEQPTAALPATPGVVPTLPGGVPTAAPNVTAAPVLTDPFLPGTPGTTASTDALGRAVVIGPPVATTAGGPVIAPSQPVERISITPSRILAPIGGEVILRAGVCPPSGHLRINERVEWMLDRAGTGHIVEVGNAYELDMFRRIVNTPRKIDNYFAIGATSPFNQCIDRGTPNPADDVQVRRGDAWISITSASEGTSYVTAYAPDVNDWSGRTARAVVYWVDAQWSFPPPVTLAIGESHTLTTTVTRQSDGTPISGWIVRYVAEGGGAGLGYEGGQSSEVRTNEQGRASIEISPTNSQSGTTNIAVEIIRPEQAGSTSSPRVTLGRGNTSITWGDGGIAGSPLPPTTPPVLPPIDAGPVNPPITPPADNNPPTPPAATQADLFLQIEQISPGPFRVGDQVEFSVTVINQGEAVARNVKIVDEFDLGLSNAAAAPGENSIKTDFFELASGESFTLPPLVFTIEQPGQLSHSVQVTADNALTQNERAFITAQSDAVVNPPTLNVAIDGPDRHTVGDLALFRIRVTNNGTSPASNVVVVNDRDPELVPKRAFEPYDVDIFTSTGQLRWPVGVLAPGTSAVLEVECECTTATGVQGACCRFQVSADGMTQAIAQEKCLEIRPRLGVGGGVAPGGGGAAAPPATATGEPVALTIDTTVDSQRIRSGQPFVLYVEATNNTNQALTAPKLRVLIPPQFTPNLDQLPESFDGNPVRDERGTVLNFAPAGVQPRDRLSIAISLRPDREGSSRFFSGFQSNEIAEVVKFLDAEVIGR